MKLPVQPQSYTRGFEQQRSSTLEREMARTTKKDADESISGEWEFQKPVGLFTDQGGGWRDMLGQAVSPVSGVVVPIWTQIGSSPFYAYAYQLNDTQWFFYHIQHDYTPGTSIYLHSHWLTDGTSTATVKWEFTWTFAKGFNQGAGSTYNITGPTVTVEEAASGTAYQHMTSEIATPISDSDFEVDGILMVRLRRITNGGTDNANTVFLTMADCHYQSNTFNTKNRTPNFYT